ncbi:MAG: hypothetical protein BGWL_c1640 [Candidatus Phytoplasma cynodontis]|uniref:hypothetical protein n=1 Tax='Cynodon dactylon' phytoplasma TaxID=295320 RepID=UPI001265AF23|nr:hypothetical protein ['Cynodon dactylon' phytoplasma]KAB8121938.1 hypothetical protein F1741_00075 ['Cynodon dactylon' phytoplasma]WIA07653.1 MAG: hypothetical protein BGWL_c1640 [Candidatus Phytoplasma cynodontis]
MKNILSQIQFLMQFRFFLSFFSGFFFGFIFSFLFYLFFFIKNFNKEFKVSKTQNDDLDYDKMLLLIKETQKNFLKNLKKDKDEYIFFLFKNIQEMTLKVASSFYPNSNYPYLELTIEESLTLVKYIHQRIDELFNKKIIFMFKKITLRKIFLFRQKIIKKKYIRKFKKTNKILNIFTNTLNILNPFHWLKKIFLNNLYNILVNKIGCAIIFILGEEIYKIYSKKLFESNDKQNLDDFLEDLQKKIDQEEEENI